MDSLALYSLTQQNYLANNIPQLLYETTLGTTGPATYTVVIPYNRILCTWYARSSVTGSAFNVDLQMNGDSAAHYLWQITQGNGATATSQGSGGLASFIEIGVVPGTSATANYWGSGQFIVDGANQANTFPTAQGTSCAFASSTSGYMGMYGGQYVELGVITSLALTSTGGSFIAGSQFSFYGLN